LEIAPRRPAGPMDGDHAASQTAHVLTPKQDDSLGTVTRLEQTVNFLAFTKFYETHTLASPILIHSRPLPLSA
jgi:hypothetical protein